MPYEDAIYAFPAASHPGGHDSFPPSKTGRERTCYLVFAGRRHLHHPGILRLHYLYLGGEGCGDFLLGEESRIVPLHPGQLLAVPPKMLCGCLTDSGMIYTEIILKKENFTMNNILKAGQPTELKDLISYEDGSIANLDLVHADNMKFVLMAFDEGTGLTPHRAPGNAILTALEGKAIIGYEGQDYELAAGQSFRFDKNGLHSVTAQGKFKMSLLLVIE